MHLLAQVPYAAVELHWSAPVLGPAHLRARQLRGALAAAFGGDDLFHQHDAAGRALYRYPRVQYRWHRGCGVVVGWQEAAEKLLNLPWLDLALRLGADEATVAEAHLATTGGTFGWDDRLRYYRFGSPVLLFNQENYARYQTMKPEAQRRERDRLLVAQTLVALRELGVRFEGRLYAAFAGFRAQVCRYKEQDLLGLTGWFVSNAVLPTGFAFGHAVSHGYGWIAPLDEEADGE
ncbi:MAG: hypothetical protein HZB55_05355 [Deltaproteobacteria bacterium]|nr:hypothetical protein [Deltaproteobacteria bacterium]